MQKLAQTRPDHMDLGTLAAVRAIYHVLVRGNSLEESQGTHVQSPTLLDKLCIIARSVYPRSVRPPECRGPAGPRPNAWFFYARRHKDSSRD
ncbi:hypothetical protein SBBP2_320010 [Burkholderiales bacterium]|nr:hypothetical protein SBBP2_320010 [Burkholderiales bacterium]